MRGGPKTIWGHIQDLETFVPGFADNRLINPKMSSDKNSGGVESVLALVLYFARNKYWHHVQTVADQVIKKRGRAPVLSFWKAYSVGREGEYSNSIRQFDDLRSKREVRLPICFGGV